MTEVTKGAEKETAPAKGIGAATVTAPSGEAAAGRGAALRVEGAGISFGDFRTVQGIDLDIAAGRVLLPARPSGCGKSTLLSAMAGFIRVSEGSLTADGVPVSGPDPNSAWSSKAVRPFSTG
ncbi:ATP-binding cassette domain-containing protein [Streptomyces sp. NPDC013455]|uniref:ATP-binding cassette domain-containing protein n=1 Tax=Streptomyces sp. NPDC013455 TaxID=3155605 RepID=UPI0033CE597D